jgi:hypothetical protein
MNKPKKKLNTDLSRIERFIETDLDSFTHTKGKDKKIESKLIINVIDQKGVDDFFNPNKKPSKN